MRLTSPQLTIRVGEVEIRGVQHVLEMQSSDTTAAHEPLDHFPSSFRHQDDHGPNHHQQRQKTPGTPWLGPYAAAATQQARAAEEEARASEAPPPTPALPPPASAPGTPETQAVPLSALHAIQARTAIVVPCKDECVARIAGVWGAIPPPSLIILVSGSSSPARFARERDALAAFCRLTGRRGLAVHQRDPEVAAALREAGMGALLMERRRQQQQQQSAPTTPPGGDEEGCADGDSGDGLEEEAVHMGKGEGLVIGIALAATARGPPRGYTARGGCGRGGGGGGAARCCGDYRCGPACENSVQRTFEEYGQQDEMTRCCYGGATGGQNTKRATNTKAGGAPGYYKYIGFIDADNFVPVSVEEYCRAFSTGLYLAQAEDAMVRISWPSKPKVRNGELDFSQSGRSSEIVNRWLNGLLGNMDGVSIETRAGAGGAGGIGGGFGAACAAAMMGYEVPTAADDLICTGNAGEHAMTISLALKLRLASGYAIEPFHFLDIFERFAGPSDVGVDAAAAAAAAVAAGITTADVAGIASSKQKHGDFAADLLPSSPISLPTTLTSPVTTPTTPVDSGSPRLSACASPSSSSSSSSSLSSILSSSRDPTSSPTTTHADLPSAPSSPPPPLSPLSLSAPFSSSSDRSSSLGVGSDTVPAVLPPPRVQILQIRPLSPHFHENKGEAHVERMWKQGLSAVYYSPVTAAPGLARYREELRSTIFRGGDGEMMMKKKNTKSGDDDNNHGGGVGGGPVTSLPTPPLSSSGSEATTPSSEDGVGGVLGGDGEGVGVGVGVGDEGAAVLAAAGWQPERCRVYPPAGSMRLEAFRARLERGSGSFWWSEKAVQQKPSQQSPGLLGFDSIAVLGLGPVSRERRPEGDVDGFKACVDETERR